MKNVHKLKISAWAIRVMILLLWPFYFIVAMMLRDQIVNVLSCPVIITNWNEC